MKNLTLTFLFVLLIGKCADAQYIVTKVAGRVKGEDGVYIKPGSQLKGSEHLTWSSLKDKLWVVIIGKGEKTIAPSPDVTATNNVFVQLLSSSLHQDSKSASLSGRGNSNEKIPEALHTSPGSNGKLIIENENKFLFDPQQYPQADDGFFFLEIDVPLQVPVTRRLKTNADTLYINYYDLATETYNADYRYRLGYRRLTGTAKSESVSFFDPYFDLAADMETTIASAILAYQATGVAKDAARDSVYQNVYSNIGKPNSFLFNNAFERYWQSKGVYSRENNTPLGTGAITDGKAFDSLPKQSASVITTRAELPAHYSLRQYAPPIGNQGDLSSCVGWATSYAARTIAYAAAHGYTKTSHYDLLLQNTFAPDFIYNNIKRSNDCSHGTYMLEALRFMKKYGDIKKGRVNFVCGKTYSNDDLSAAQGYRIKDIIPIPGVNHDRNILVQNMKSYIVNNSALPFLMILPVDFANIDGTGVWNPTPGDYTLAVNARKGLAEPNAHAMCVIGYDDKEGGGSFEVMNSWGDGFFGNTGFCWINYDDFFRFAEEVYAITDSAPPIEDAPVEKMPDKVATIVPLAVNVPVTVTKPAKPKLKGSIEYTLIDADGSFETIPVNKGLAGADQSAAGKPKVAAFANFTLTKPFYSGSKYKVKFSLSKSAYVYIVGVGKDTSYTLFPDKDKNESALINFDNSTLYLPDPKHHYQMNNVPGLEKTCVLVSKSPIDIDGLLQKYKSGSHNFYGDIRDFLSGRLLEMRSDTFTDDRIDFDTGVNDNDVLAFFVEMNHL